MARYKDSEIEILEENRTGVERFRDPSGREWVWVNALGDYVPASMTEVRQ
jgi:hypothetical protein